VSPSSPPEVARRHSRSRRQRASTTETAPPPKLPSHRSPFGTASSGNQILDHRGEVWYTAGGTTVKIVDLGDPTALGFGISRSPSSPLFKRKKRDLLVRLQEELSLLRRSENANPVNKTALLGHDVRRHFLLDRSGAALSSNRQ
jgi:hypothetical protein